MNYYDIDSYYENLTDEEADLNNEYEYKVATSRSRFSLEDALNYDKKFVNELLNKDSLTKVEKHWIASMHNRECEAYLELTRVSTSFDEFVQERLGKEKYDQFVGEWLQRQGNEFFQSIGMEEEMKPSSVYFMGIDLGEEE